MNNKSKKINIAIIGLGQIGNYLYNELRLKKNEIGTLTNSKINIVAISAKNPKKKKKIQCKPKNFLQKSI